MRTSILILAGVFFSVYGFGLMHKQREVTELTTVTPKGYAAPTNIQHSRWDEKFLAADANVAPASVVDESAAERSVSSHHRKHRRHRRHARRH